MNFGNTKVSELVEHLFTIYKSIFGKGATTERDMLFANALIDYNRRALVNSMNMGIQKDMLPIAEISVWQGVREGDDTFYTVRVETVGGGAGEANNLDILVSMVQDAINKWGDESFDGFISVFDPDKDDAHKVSWILPQRKKKDEE